MSEAGYELFCSLSGVYLIAMQTALFMTIWNIFCKTKREKPSLFFAVVLLVVNLLVFFYPADTSGVRYIASAVLVLVYSCLRYGKHPEKAVFVLLLFYNFHAMSFLISSSIYQYLMDDILNVLDVQAVDYMFRMYKNLVIGQSMNLLFYTLSLLLMTAAVRKIVKTAFVMNWVEVVFLSALNIAGSMLVWMIVSISVVRIDKEVFLLFTEKREMIWKLPMIAVFICIGEISAVYIFQKYKELQEEREKHFVEEQQMKAIKRRLWEAENFYGSIRKVRHEMKNHLANIKGLVAREQYEEVEAYIGKMDETMQALSYRFNTGNAVTDVIINDKYQKAKKSGISFCVNFEYRESDTISAFDMGIVLNNLLDNAMEACEKLQQEERQISLTLKRRDHFLLVEVENSFDGVLKGTDTDGIPQTSKQGDVPDVQMEHGIGLKNVKDVAERYFGYMDIRTEGTVFKVTVMLQQREMP